MHTRLSGKAGKSSEGRVIDSFTWLSEENICFLEAETYFQKQTEDF